MKRARGRPRDPDKVNTQDDLAFRLGVTRQWLQKIRKRYADDPDLPRARGDRHSVKEWKAFFKARNIKPPADEAPPDEPERNKAYYDKERARVALARDTYNLEIEKQKHLPIDEITAALGQMLAGFRTALNNLPPSSARWLVGLRDFGAIREKLQEEVDAVLQALGRCDYLERVTPLVVETLYPDRDHAWRDDLVRATDAVFVEIGRVALSELLQRELPAAEAALLNGPLASSIGRLRIVESSVGRMMSEAQRRWLWRRRVAGLLRA